MRTLIHRKSILISFSLFFFLTTTGFNWNNSTESNNTIKTKPSGTYQFYIERLNNVLGFAETRDQIEAQIDEYVLNLGADGAQSIRAGVVIIPVVVHVIEHETTGAGNVDYAAILNQINILNTCFRRRNTLEIESLPQDIQNITADTRIEFVLANRADNCADEFVDGEPGVTRTRTSQSPFIIDRTHSDPYTRYPMKYSEAYGRDGFSHEDYLNIWVCELDGDACGYASIPGDPTYEDGIVVDYRCFAGSQSISPFDEGKVLVQLAAQWLNLYNIWGIETSSCSDSDEVEDTPNQEDANYGCPILTTSCGNSGDMFMNFMDATNDNCRKFFTQGQSNRMEATLFTYRASLLNSPGAIPIASSGGSDIWMQDTPEDIGDEPNLESEHLWRSQDIWIRNDPFPQEEVNITHQNPISGYTNYVYVRVRNRGCSGLQQGTLKVYWAKASTGLSYPYPWDGSVSEPVLLGGEIGRMQITVLAGESRVYEIPWDDVPNPQDYEPYYGDKAHFCLLAIIETPGDNKPDLPSSDISNKLGWFVRNNNNVIWKNITIAEPVGVSYAAEFTVSNFEVAETNIRLEFKVPEQNTPPIAKGNLIVELGKMNELWEMGGSQGQNVKPIDGGKLLLTANNSYIENIKLPAKSHYDVNVAFEPDDKKITRQELFQLDIEQYSKDSDEALGGQSVYFKTEPFDSTTDTKWELIETGVKNDLLTAHFPTDKIGYAAGSWGCIIKTIDGGKSWKRSSKGIPFCFTIHSIFFIDEMKGFAAACGGQLFITTNGGENWKRKKITGWCKSLKDIHFIDKRNGFIIAENALYKTTNEGNSWENVNNILPNGISSADLKTAKIYFINNAIGFILLNGKILKTIDSGNSWKIIDIPGGTLTDIDFIDVKRGYLCGVGTGLLKTTNSGDSWKKVHSFSYNSSQTLKFIDYKHGYVCGVQGQIYQTNNYANSWILNSIATKQDIHEVIYLYDLNVIIGFAKKGRVLISKL
jgi:photosystem II stability/assembly factor-like uncharacterized protein